ncbi:hypothetical protein NCCP1664_22220 [Zafaria cholistanensis]|uniref:Uncharacterized protein n=1 Tax=Zafaria cholistanensis TaxID=1682741 RepID=A0A5A7NUV1_9MICC|nr:hypothetical protein NCCP1664_22220 [Zafaria cholistanensis]
MQTTQKYIDPDAQGVTDLSNLEAGKPSPDTFRRQKKGAEGVAAKRETALIPRKYGEVGLPQRAPSGTQTHTTTIASRTFRPS